MTPYSALDKFGERLCSGTKEQCEQFIKNENIEGAILVRRKTIERFLDEVDKLTDEEDKTSDSVDNVPKTYTYVARHERGGQIVFNNLEAVAKRFDISEQTLGEKLEKGAYKLRGRMKQWTIEKIEK